MNKWISVKDGLPVNYQDVIMVNYRDGDVVAGYCHDGDWYSELYGGTEIDGITHWMPLPEPPGVEK